MNYELVLKLKEAGFPLSKGVSHDGKSIVFPEGILYKLPTLSELIEVCGEVDVHISYRDGRIYAEFEIDDGNGNNLDFFMNSLEEIYANLWLELNKKND